ncbi:hypothetical protein [Acidihalobacter prosperus]|uniref:Uncharacterized protein n=1 Tax=Acidihalobacter prosperus TaxID=160660 RepID=A0A1A6C8U4_9GAMM|nr:hypothetical protein [Acidihalobacter prosperus]OBS10976.1 hypothetical protein Thpro_020692 [Acidihalobacter prosperus]
MLEISVRFAPGFPDDARAGLRAEGDVLPEYGQVWIWDMAYAQTLHALAGSEAARSLREDLELWGINMSSKVFQPMDHIRAKGHLNLRQGFALDDTLASESVLAYRITGAAGELPKVEIEAAADLDPQARAAAVLALGQFFIEQNDLFAKELPLHVLAFRKFYGDVAPESDPSSVEDAPMFAIQKALEYFNSVAGAARH